MRTLSIIEICDGYALTGNSTFTPPMVYVTPVRCSLTTFKSVNKSDENIVNQICGNNSRYCGLMVKLVPSSTIKIGAIR